MENIFNKKYNITNEIISFDISDATAKRILNFILRLHFQIILNQMINFQF